eukprot:gene5184-5259_t
MGPWGVEYGAPVDMPGSDGKPDVWYAKSRHWSYEQVLVELSTLHISPEALELFRHHKVTGYALLTLSEDQLRVDPFNITDWTTLASLKLFIEECKAASDKTPPSTPHLPPTDDGPGPKPPHRGSFKSKTTSIPRTSSTTSPTPAARKLSNPTSKAHKKSPTHPPAPSPLAPLRKTSPTASSPPPAGLPTGKKRPKRNKKKKATRASITGALQDDQPWGDAVMGRLFDVVEVPDKGKTLRTNFAIAAGTTVLAEAPLMVIHPPDEASVQALQNACDRHNNEAEAGGSEETHLEPKILFAGLCFFKPAGDPTDPRPPLTDAGRASILQLYAPTAEGAPLTHRAIRDLMELVYLP